MKLLTVRKSLRKFLLFAIAFLSMHLAFAKSPYDGIWHFQNGDHPEYFSINITNGQLIFISLSEVARTQSTLRGAYMGLLPNSDGSSSLPEPPFEVGLEFTPGSTEVFYWWRQGKIVFRSKDEAVLYYSPLVVWDTVTVRLKKVF